MVAKWAEGFETHTGAQLVRKYATVTGTFLQQSGRVFGSSISTFTGTLVTPSLGLSTTYVIGFGVRINSALVALNTGGQGLYLEKGSNEQCHIEFDNNVGSFELRLMRGSTEVAVTTSTFAYGVWHYFEVKVTVDDTVGAVEIRQNEVSVLTSTALNTADDTGSQADIFAMRFSSNISGTFSIDDIYVVDTVGTVNNDFLGDSIVEGILPDANGTTIQWANDAGSGSNFNNVDDAVGATDELTAGGTNSSDTNGQKDLYSFENLVQTQGNVHFVQVGTQLAMSAAGSRTVKTVYRDPDTTEVDLTTHTVDATEFDEFTEVHDVNPNSAAPWDVAELNGGEFGVEVVS
jgi:hypothetical protein